MGAPPPLAPQLAPQLVAAAISHCRAEIESVDKAGKVGIPRFVAFAKAAVAASQRGLSLETTLLYLLGAKTVASLPPEVG